MLNKKLITYIVRFVKLTYQNRRKGTTFFLNMQNFFYFFSFFMRGEG